MWHKNRGMNGCAVPRTGVYHHYCCYCCFLLLLLLLLPLLPWRHVRPARPGPARPHQAFFIGVQIEVEDAEVMPFPTTRQTLQEMLLDEEEKDFWDDAELAPAQESATVAHSLALASAGDEKPSDAG